MATAKEIANFTDKDCNHGNCKASAQRTSKAETQQDSYSIPGKKMSHKDLA